MILKIGLCGVLTIVSHGFQPKKWSTGREEKGRVCEFIITDVVILYTKKMISSYYSVVVPGHVFIIDYILYYST